MKQRRLHFWLLSLLGIAVLVLTGSALGIHPEVENFEGFEDLEVITSQIPGLTFANATILTAGISLNEFELPPRSGVNVIVDDGGPIKIVFATPVSQVSGFFTYLVPVTLTAFCGDAEVDSATSAFASNLALSGDPGSNPNEFLEVTATCGITRVLIEGDTVGFAFVLDDLNFTPALAIVSNLVSFVPLSSTFETVSDTTGCPVGFAGKFSFTARLTDQSTSPPLSDLVVQVKALSNGNLVHNADGGPGGAGAMLTVPETGQFADGVLSPDEFVDVPFVICLKFDARFEFLVDVLGSIREGMI